MLEDYRDVAIGSLRDANQDMRLWIREAVDALFGQSSLRSELGRRGQRQPAELPGPAIRPDLGRPALLTP